MTDWIALLPGAAQLTLFFGGLAVAFIAIVHLLEIIKKWIRGANGNKICDELSFIKKQLTAFDGRLSKIEIDVAHLDKHEINARFDRIEGKIDDLVKILLEDRKSK